MQGERSSFFEKMDAIKIPTAQEIGGVALALLGVAAPVGLCYVSGEQLGGAQAESIECFDPAGLTGELDGAGYRGQEDVSVTIELANGTNLQMPSGTEFEVIDTERAQSTLNPDGESSSYSTLTIAIENDTYSISEASVKAGWVDVEGLESREIDEITLCRLENETPPSSDLVVMADSKQD